MTRTERIAERGRKAARKAFERVENRFLAAQGRKAVQEKVRTAKQMTGKAARAGLVVGTLTAASVLSREIRKRRGRG